jgi:hypothetical protein
MTRRRNKDNALVKNASDEGQVRKAGKQEKLNEEDYSADLRAVLGTKQGRRVLWSILTKCRVFESIWHGSALIHYNSGQQDVGHMLMSEIVEADQDMFFKMMVESKNGEY